MSRVNGRWVSGTLTSFGKRRKLNFLGVLTCGRMKDKRKLILDMKWHLSDAALSIAVLFIIICVTIKVHVKAAL